MLYRDEWLYVRIAAFDRRLWYDTSPSPNDLTAWDAATLYLDLDGNVGDTPDANAYRFDGQLVWWEDRDNYSHSENDFDTSACQPPGNPRRQPGERSQLAYGSLGKQ